MHYTSREHKCTSRCKPHICKPLGEATIRKIHFIISGAYKRAIRYEWISFNPVLLAETPEAPPPDPQPPTAEQAAALVNEAWRWGFGPFMWLAMVTGARRGEMCALRWEHLHVRHAQYGPHDCVEAGCQWSLHIRRAIGQDGKEFWEKDTKQHQIRMVALDIQTVAILTDLRDRAERIARMLGIELASDAFIFAKSPDGQTPYLPESMSKRYARIAKRLKLNTTLKSLRHFSATELIAEGVDIRTVAGRLGHSGGGTTTLKVYAAFLSARDQHASTVLMHRMPAKPQPVLVSIDRGLADPQTPFETVAAELFCAMLDGAYPPGTPLPSVKELALAHSVSMSTAQRAMTVLKDKGVIKATSGTRAVAMPIDETDPAVIALREHRGGSLATLDSARAPSANDPRQPPTSAAEPSAVGSPAALDLELLRMDVPVRKLWTEADPGNFVQLRKLMESAVKRIDGDLSRIDEYELTIRRAGEPQVIRTLVVAA
ncbi:tyrosine-type recombinase/integrase [Kibdelosporangium aridum]|uniref:tyrosine-type recombinase/integrase n=1 Tax=Kibdelosporangium aridum TaxID=2030 RepID=UPI00069144FA